MTDRRPPGTPHFLKSDGLLRRHFLGGSLAAGAFAIAGTQAWAQNGATVPDV